MDKNDRPERALAVRDVMSLEPTTDNIEMLIPDLVDKIKAVRAFEWFKGSLIKKGQHVVQMKTKRGPAWHINKAGWRLVAHVLGVSTEVVSIDWLQVGNTWYVRARVRAYRGDRSIENVGNAFPLEGTRDNPIVRQKEHLEALAITRAMNRAISDFVGAGEVSAEELDVPEPPEPPENTFEMKPVSAAIEPEPGENAPNDADAATDVLASIGDKLFTELVDEMRLAGNGKEPMDTTREKALDAVLARMHESKVTAVQAAESLRDGLRAIK